MRALLFVMSLVVSSVAMAEELPFQGCNSGGCIGKLGSIYIKESGEIAITKPEDGDKEALACTLSSGNYFTLKRTHAAFDEIYSLVLAAQMAQKNVFLRAKEGTSDCEIKYAVVYP